MLYHPLPIDYHFPKGKMGREKGETMIKISVRKKSPWQQSTIPDPVNTRGEYKKDQTKTVPSPVSAMKFPFYNFKNIIYKIRGFRKNLREEFFFTM